MKQKAVTVLEPAKEGVELCQLGKLSKRRCSLRCAFDHDCPVFYIDSHDMPLVKKFRKDVDSG